MKTRIIYFVKIKKNELTQSYVFYSEDTELNPLITFSEKDWEKTDYIPDTAILIKADTVENNVDETELFSYFYDVEIESKENKLPRKICKNCISFCEKYINGRYRALCSNKNNAGIDYVKGEVLLASCIKFNSIGQCHYYSEKPDDEN